ncbi:ABC transporter ATP-binding protein [Carboxylicivirga sp. N1Y90]|uniref:ABC transporter ATP-binding protein n=1 Tax=Carboxylicivirga fragile TaxID=3417571 RepID=UPI003D35268B|nr:ABC transporter ATP-binding protein [Marinilabiliaceae bacterium N1Y90]
MENEQVIIVRDLVKKFGDFTANAGLNFHVDKGEIFGFLGANGAGKTTAMRILCGLSSPTSGLVEVAGYNVKTHAEEVKKRIGYMSQKFSLFEDLTIWENMRFFSTVYGMNKTAFKERGEMLLRKLELFEKRNRLVSTLSLGWKQKLAFTVAILHEPSIVFLDEPTGGVDPITRRQFWEMIYEAADNGITVFVTTHYMDEAEYCNRVTIMVDGRIDALDTPAKLKEKYQVNSMNDVFLALAR